MRANSEPPSRWRPSPNVWALSAVSFLTDASSEIIAPLLPIFLTTTLGASARMVGVIEGAAEAVAALLKLASGWWSDRAKRRKPLVVWGYTLSSVVRPLMALSMTASQVMAIRLADRVGKGLRGPPRDALLAASTPPANRGRAFGFHRAADHAGAVVGPLIAILCLSWFGMSVRDVFWVAAIPGALAVIVVFVWVGEVRPTTDDVAGRPEVRAAHDAAPATSAENARAGLPADFSKVMVAIAVFTLGNSTDAFLILRANQLGVPVAMIPLLWMALHAVKSASSTPGGALSDRVGRAPLIIGGWVLYALVYVGFAMADQAWHAWTLFGLYGLVFGLSEGTEKALVADLVPAGVRGRAFGWYQATIGVMALPASLVFGIVWDRYGASAAFTMGAALACFASLLLALFLGLGPVRPDRALE